MIRTLRLATTILLAVPSIGRAEEDRGWHLLTQTYGGAVSLLKDLTEHECDFARKRLLGLPATAEEFAAVKAELDRKEEDRIRVLDSWIAIHPECHSQPLDKIFNLPQCAPIGLSGYVVGEIRSVSSSDARTAECFR